MVRWCTELPLVNDWILPGMAIISAIAYAKRAQVTNWLNIIKAGTLSLICLSVRPSVNNTQKFNLGHIFGTSICGTLMFTCAFLVTRPFIPFYYSWPSELDLEFYLFFKYCYFDLSFLMGKSMQGSHIWHMHFWWQDLSNHIKIFDLLTLSYI